MTPTPMPDTTLTSAELDELTSAIDQLQNHQTQLDMDGVAVGVSRQALDIVLEALARAGLEAGKAEESMRERAADVIDTWPLPADSVDVAVRCAEEFK